jgi:hypothetical protein
MGYTSDSLTVEVKESAQDIGIVRLSEGQQLSGVTVSAKRLIMRDELDRLVYDVTQDPEAKRVKMMDIMKKIPFMAENAKDGKLQYLNDRIFTIMIDGKPNEMINGSRQFPMRLIKGDVMSRIEIILPGTKDNPGEKPILNIKLSRELPDGYAAEVIAKGDNQKKVEGGIDMVTKFNKLYLSIKYGMDYQDRPKLESFTYKENMNEEASIPLQRSSSKSWGDNTSHNLAFGASYTPTNNDFLNASISADKSNSIYYTKNVTENYNRQNQIINTKEIDSKNKYMSNPTINGAFSYRHYIEKKSYLSFQYNRSETRNNNSFLTYNQKSNNDSKILDRSTNLTFSNRENNTKIFDASLSYTERHYSNSSDFEYWDYDSQNTEEYFFRHEGLDYNQYIYKAKSRYAYNGRKLTFTVSLTAEQMINKGVFHSTEDSKLDYNELNFFPNIKILYKTKSRYKLAISYNTRILRPNINYLNPYTDFTDPDNITKGNPDLKAEYANVFKFDLTKSFGNNVSLDISSGIEFINKSIERITTVDNNSISTTTYENVGNGERFMTSVSLFFKPAKWCSIRSVGDVRYNRYKNSFTNLNNNIIGFGYYGNVIMIFSKATLSLGYKLSPIMGTAQTQKVKYMHTFGFDISKSLLKNKLYLVLNLDDPFRSHRYVQNIIGNDLFKMTTKREQMGRVLGFSLRWNFGRLKDKVQSTNSDNAPSDLVRPDLLSK